MPNGVIQSRQYRTLRAEMKAQWQPINAACAICGQPTIEWDSPPNQPNAFEMDHRISRKRAAAMGRPELNLDPNNMQPTHHRCNRSKSSGPTRATIGENTEDW